MAEFDYKKHIGGPRGHDSWEPLGQAQFSYLLQEGLQPNHRLLDVGCGAFRLGRKVIPYLNMGNYHGFDNSQELVEAGMDQELSTELCLEKQPSVLVDSQFTFDPGPYHYIWAFMLLPSLKLSQANYFLRAADKVLAPGGRIYVVYRQIKESARKTPGSYTIPQVFELATGTTLTPMIRRDWNWEPSQSMALFVKPPLGA